MTASIRWYSPCGYSMDGLFDTAMPIPTCPQCYSTAWSSFDPTVVAAGGRRPSKDETDLARLRERNAALVAALRDVLRAWDDDDGPGGDLMDAIARARAAESDE